MQFSTTINIKKKTIKAARRVKARVPERTSLHSFNLLWLMWAVCGGFFITNFILSNWLQVLLKPVFEKPVDTTQVRMIHLRDLYLNQDAG